MTISSTTSKNQYTGNGSNTVFAYTFKIFEEGDIAVFENDTLQTITTHYTVSGVGNDAGGNITFVTAPANGVTVTLKRAEPLLQSIDYTENDDFPSAAHEEGLDRSVIRDQTIQEELDRSVKASDGSTFTATQLQFPASPSNGQVLSWNGDVSSGTLVWTTPATSTFFPSITDNGSLVSISVNTDINSGGAASQLTVTGSSHANIIVTDGSGVVTGTTTNGYYVVRTNNTERTRIDASGNIMVNTSTVRGRSTVLHDGASQFGFVVENTDATVAGQTSVGFMRNGSYVGTITTTNVATAYNTSSDYRLKENISGLTNAIDRLKQLSPKRFNFIASQDDAKVDGFLAHEVQAIVPEAVTGEKDAEDEHGSPVYQGIDQSKLVPLLVAALQEAIVRIEQLESV